MSQSKEDPSLSFKNLSCLLSKIYSGVLVVTVYVSSLIFLGLIFVFLIPGFRLEYYLAFIFLCILILDLLKKPWSFLERIFSPIASFVSVLVILLCLNYFLNIYQALNEKFLLVWKSIEGLLNQTVFNIMFTVVCGLIYLYFIVWLLTLIRHILNKTHLKEKVLTPIMGILLLVFFIWVPYAVSHSNILSNNLEPALYQKIGWVGGISLIALHTNYLIRKVLWKNS